AAVVQSAWATSPWAVAHGVNGLNNLRGAAPWSCLVVVQALLLVMAGRQKRWSLPLLIVITACDQGLWGYQYLYRGGAPTVAVLAANAVVPSEARSGELIRPQGVPNQAILRGMRSSQGYVGLTPASLLDPDDPIAQRIAGVTWRPTEAGWARVADTMARARL